MKFFTHFIEYKINIKFSKYFRMQVKIEPGKQMFFNQTYIRIFLLKSTFPMIGAEISFFLLIYIFVNIHVIKYGQLFLALSNPYVLKRKL